MKYYLFSLISIGIFLISCANENHQDIVDNINEEMNLNPTRSGPSTEKLQNIDASLLPNIQFKYPARDNKGWTIITPSTDSRLIYVSSSEGDDNKATFYTKDKVNDVFYPQGIVAFKTIAKAMMLVRDGYPDWVLLKKGDEWIIDKALSTLSSGRSMEEPLVFTGYGVSDKRPIIKTGISTGLQMFQSPRFITMSGIEFYAHKRDPDSVYFIGWEDVGSPVGFICLTDDEQDVESIVLEDNVFRFYAVNIQISGKKNANNVVVRRNQILDSYNTGGHSQGVFIANASLLLEENFMDHNGWYQKRYGQLNEQYQGQATVFNHNAYLVHLKNSIITENIVSRSSSIGLKFTSNSNKESGINEVNSYNITVDNNLFIEGEVGISIGGNTDFDNGFRWKNINILNNVMLNIGEGQPTNRNIAWHIEAIDWDGGSVIGNYLLFNDNDNVTNVSGINIKGLSKDILVDSNVLYKTNAKDERNIYFSNQEIKENVMLYNNKVDNSHYIDNTRKDIDSYMKDQGKEGGLISFIGEAMNQSKENWDSAYTVDSINKYLKAQFDNGA